MMRKAVTLVIITAALSGCGAASPKDELAEEMQEAPALEGVVSVEELRLYIEQEQPETVAYIRYQQPFRWRGLNNYFAITEARTGPHLIEMSWECKELISRDLLTDMIDHRSENRLMRAGIDTIRGCRIKRFYRLPEPADDAPVELHADQPDDEASGEVIANDEE